MTATTRNTDPRGPHRTVATVDSRPDAHHVTYVECGHTGRLTRHFMAPRPGEQVRCFQCGPHGTADREGGE